MGDSFWTSYSDLFVGMSVIFLVLFFFATLRAGVLQMQAALDKKKHDAILKGQVPQDVAEKTQRQQATVRNTLTVIQKKKEEIGQLAKHLEDEQTVFNEVLKDQEEKSAMLKSAYDTNVKLETEVKDLEALKAKLRDGLIQKDTAINNLSDKIQKLEDAKTASERVFHELTENVKSKDEQLASRKLMVADLTRNLEKQQQAIEQTQNALETEQGKSARLLGELQEHGKELQQALTAASNANKQVSLLKQDVASRDGQIIKVKTELGEAGKAIAGLRSEVEGREGEITQLKTTNTGLRSEVSARDSTIFKMSADAAEALREMAGLKKEILGRNVEINKLKGDLLGLHHDMASRDGQIAKLKGELGVAKTQIGGLTEDLAVRDGQLGKLKGALAGVQRELAGRDGDIAALKGELGSAKRELTGLGDELAARDHQISKLKGELGDLERGMAGRDGTLAKLKSQLGQAGKEVDDLKGELDHLKKFYADAQGNDKDKARTIASLGDQLKKAHDEIGELSKLRKEIAGGVLRNLQRNGVDVAVDPDSGVITLSMDEVFRFKNGSYEISDSSQAKIKKIMPVYAESLLGTPEQAAKIAGIVITGHASPRYKKHYVNPASQDRAAYIFNLDLSMKRAHQVAAYIFGESIGYYAHKQELKVRTSVAGKGFMDPAVRVAGGDTTEACGEYDCPKSRRVEINFILKENKIKNVLAHGNEVQTAARSIAGTHPSVASVVRVATPMVQATAVPEPIKNQNPVVALPKVDDVYGPPVPAWIHVKE